MTKSILEMTEREVQLERWELERAGLLADASWYLENLLKQFKIEESQNAKI
jgi:hypothetical protein